MNEDQHHHFHAIFSLIERLAEPKYSKGAVEHGGNIWELSDEDLEIAELAEMIDFLVYRATRIKKKLDKLTPKQQAKLIDKIRSGILK